MRIISRVSLAAEATERWYNTYCRQGVWVYGENKRVIYEKLVALGPNPAPNDVDYTIGNVSWTICKCDSCSVSCEEVVEVGQELYYDSSTAKLCKSCAWEAFSMIESRGE